MTSVALFDRRGASETIGFVFVFALVTASVGVIYTTGIGGLADAREDEQLTNAVRAFDVLDDNVADLTREGAPSRATELKLSDAGLGFGDPVTFEVQVNHTDTDANATYRANTRPLVYSGEAGKVVFSAGATFRVDGGSAAMRSKPGFLVDDRRSLVPLLVAYPQGGSGGVGGSSTVLVVTHRQSQQLDGEFDTGPDAADEARVNVTVESPRAAAWGRYFEAQGMTAIDGTADDGDVTYQFRTDHLLVSETVVEFDINA
ncbi:hypothetical protein M0R89_13735 [Halorussus limi]|uniref:Uncharacterized protein n=1 Tax=Halorussus limi TaxID=2938695 RepID=A0A8U0HRB1_9EURY|nr:hypothetical protein [Halorussus limi]UPV73595.1 hypothetical protein M0R89_13735 [Halorussus limi]